ncbi:MAG: pyruvate ferredoxin oxidoreductase, partial [Gemmatimonadetes bacterium]|nr:pyruvate ferredoxin oxidoreductase [Gemmatimonadota bacterium]
YTVCPDTAMPGLVTDVGAALDTVVKRLRRQGAELKHLPKAVRLLERRLRGALREAKETDPFSEILEDSIRATLKESDLGPDETAKLKEEFERFREAMSGFPFALTRPYWAVPEKQNAGDGGLFSIAVNPYTCKGCMECINVCDDDALRLVPQTESSVARLREQWEFWLDLPTTPAKYSRISDLDRGIGALETLLLDKSNYLSFTSGDGACLGCSEKTAIHLFVATVEALMQPRVARHVEKLGELIGNLERHVQLKLVGEMHVDDDLSRLLAESADKDLTLSDLAKKMESREGGRPIDQDWLRRVTKLVADLKALRAKYLEGTTGRGRSRLGMLNATGCTSVWGSTYPFNPYPFPWANHLFQDAASVAMGVFEGHMAKMAEGFRAVRLAELELAGQYDPARHDEELRYFDWTRFTDDEWELCPPVVAVGGDGAMYDIG